MLTRYMSALIIILLIAQTKTANSTENKTLTMCVSHFSPHQIVLPGKTPMGENIAATTHFFNKLGYTVRFTQNNTIWRCLGMLKAGKVDIMSGLLDAPERRDFAHLFAYSSLSQKSFYVNKNNNEISSFSDLKGLKVAVLKGIKQFEQFDNTPDDYFEKVYVNDINAAFRVLVAGKVDVFISTDFNGIEKYKKQISQEIKEIKVTLDNAALLFIAVSKKSKVAHLASKFSELSKKMHKDNEFQKVISEFRIKNPEYYR